MSDTIDRAEVERLLACKDLFVGEVLRTDGGFQINGSKVLALLAAREERDAFRDECRNAINVARDAVASALHLEKDNARLRRFVAKVADPNHTLPLEPFLRQQAREVLEQQG